MVWPISSSRSKLSGTKLTRKNAALDMVPPIKTEQFFKIREQGREQPPKQEGGNVIS
jgi:hypothetical protein